MSERGTKMDAYHACCIRFTCLWQIICNILHITSCICTTASSWKRLYWHSQTYTHTHTHAHAHAHTCTRMRTRARARKHTYTHARTHTHTHTHMHTHTHTHARACARARAHTYAIRPCKNQRAQIFQNKLQGTYMEKKNHVSPADSTRYELLSSWVVSSMCVCVTLHNKCVRQTRVRMGWLRLGGSSKL